MTSCCYGVSCEFYLFKKYSCYFVVDICCISVVSKDFMDHVCGLLKSLFVTSLFGVNIYCSAAHLLCRIEYVM